MRTPRKEYQRKYCEEHRDVARERARKHYQENKEHHQRLARARYLKNREATIAASRKWAKENPEDKYKIQRKHHLKRQYWITQQEYDSMLEAQGGRCAICKGSEPGGRFKNWHIDHCHKSTAVRSLLCADCNQMLGFAKDNVATLAAAIEYLRKTSDLAAPAA
jgi:hypothetical protein